MTRLTLSLIGVLLPAACTYAQVTQVPLPRQLVCRASERLTANVRLDAAGAPLGAGVFATSGTHECGLQSDGAGVVQADGAVKFAWTAEDEGKAYTAMVKRVGADGYSMSFQPAGCGTIALPASLSLSAQAKGCKARVDRDAAFVLFWRQFKTAIAQRDGDMLQRLSLPQLEFSPDSGTVKAPSSIIRNAATCLPDIPTTVSGSDIGRMLKTIDRPQLDRPPLVRAGEDRVDAGAFTAKWTAKGWRLEWFNASPDVLSRCQPG